MKKVNTPAARQKLHPRREPYWNKVLTDKHLGYRKCAESGTWIAQWTTKEKQTGAGRRRTVQKRLGDESQLSYDEAFRCRRRPTRSASRAPARPAPPQRSRPS